jgi:nicotinamidase-related amidase
MAHVCVSTTARQAAEKGYDVILPQQAIGDRNIPGVNARDLVQTTLMELADAFGSIVQVADIK